MPWAGRLNAAERCPDDPPKPTGDARAVAAPVRRCAAAIAAARTTCDAHPWGSRTAGPEARQRYACSAELPAKNGHVLVHRHGQVIALDTTVLPVMVRESVWLRP
ncbi:hypothetical protein [Streptomyces sp. TRM49041]|uniref:hypothetical protein n=1 Tax=Streptomyces sp. TRM49041 TaxID=2603216 RepID=UPI0011ED03E8|nr:hypothetical protein [Streptomyces sp. TRM49041]